MNKYRLLVVLLAGVFLVGADMPVQTTDLSTLNTQLGTQEIEAAGSATNTTDAVASIPIEGANQQLVDIAFVVLREKADENSEKVAVLPFDEKIKVLERTGDWLKVATSKGSGYMRSCYLKGETATSGGSRAPQITLNEAPSPGTEMTIKYNGSVYLRSEDKLEADSPAQVPSGGKVKFLSQKEGWSQVEYEGKKVWVRSFYLGIAEKPAPVEAPVASTATTAAATQNETAGKENTMGGFGGRPVDGGRVTSDYGMRTIFGKRSMHYGIDFGVPTGTPAKALGDGKIAKVGYDTGGGKYVDVEYDNGYTSRYYHLKDVTMTQGARVKRGQIVAHTNNTGEYTTGAHLHFEIRDAAGNKVNPRTVNGIVI